MGDLKANQDEIDHYKYIHGRWGGKREPRWRGIHVVKFPQDLILYAQVIFKRTPDFIIETGTRFGGAAAFFGDMLSLTGGKRVFTIDTVPQRTHADHPMVEYIIGSSVDPAIIEHIKAEIAKFPNASVMASLDSDHRTKHVLGELELLKNVVTPGQYLVVEDCWTRDQTPYQPYRAAERFLRHNRNYRRYPLTKQFKYGVTKDGWLHRLR